jgi:SAM-dependent methyltransferase
MTDPRARREATLRRLGLAPAVAELLREALDEAVADAEASRARAGERRPAVTALDAGCGHRSALARHRRRIRRLVGVDIHPPEAGELGDLDELAVADVCAAADAFPPGSFDVILSSFTVEHFADPAAAFVHFARWLRPNGVLVLTTVNRRHPFVAAYLGLPAPLRRRIQPLVKARAADAHPLVGACNDPRALREALVAAGFGEVRIRAVGHLARAWGRHLPTFLLGLVGDLLARDLPARRSTLVAVARLAPARG